MTAYQFEGKDFALSNEGIHLLRSRYNFKTIQFQQVEQAVIKRGTEVSNAFVALVLGVLLTLFAFYQARIVVNFFLDPQPGTIHIETIVLPVIPALLGIYLIYISTRRGPILTVRSKEGNRKMRLREFQKSNELNNLKIYLGERLSNRLLVEGV